MPGGVAMGRSCDTFVSEGVLVTSLDARAVSAQATQYVADLAQIIARRVAMRAGDPPRTATYGVRRTDVDKISWFTPRQP